MTRWAFEWVLVWPESRGAPADDAFQVFSDAASGHAKERGVEFVIRSARIGPYALAVASDCAGFDPAAVAYEPPPSQRIDLKAMQEAVQ